MKVGDSRIDFSPGVGTFLYSSVAFQPLLPHEDVNILLQFQYSLELNVGESILFELPGFNVHESKSGDEKLFFESSGADLTFFKQGIWDPVKSHLLLNCSKLATRARLINLVIPREVGYKLGIYIPSRGVSPALDKKDFKISTNAAAGSVQPTPIISLAAVGSFQRSETLEFSSRLVGAMVSCPHALLPALTVFD
jgi:hypothetical protein